MSDDNYRDMLTYQLVEQISHSCELGLARVLVEKDLWCNIGNAPSIADKKQ